MGSSPVNDPGQGLPGYDESRLGLDSAPASTCTSSASLPNPPETEPAESDPSFLSDDELDSSIAILSPLPPHPPLSAAAVTATGAATTTTTTTTTAAAAATAVAPPPPPPPPRLATANLPASLALDRKDGFFSLGSASPPKHQSPLRHSVSSLDSPDLTLEDPEPHKTRFTTRPSKAKPDTGDKPPPERLLERIKTSDLFPPTPKSPANHSRRRSLFSPIEFKRSSSSSAEADGWTTPSSADKLSLPSPMRSTPFSFITSKMAAIKSLGSTPVSVPSNDELINLDIETALFPQGSPRDGESFSPAALMNLQVTASGLLKRFQTAYQHQAMMIQELKAEKEAQDDEKAEADVRTRHLKLQLEDMARKASETESVMQALMEELNKEKRIRLEERKSLTMTMNTMNLAQSEGSINEDLCVEEDQQRRRTWRRSGETSKSDFSFETDEDSLEEASLFSRSRSPTLAPSIMSEMSPSEQPVPLALSKPTVPAVSAMMPPPPPPPQQQTQTQTQTQTQPPPPPPSSSMTPSTRPVRTSQMSAFQKLFKGISGDGEGILRGSGGCRNCQGQDASMAWDTVGLLRVENKELKQRVGELEVAVEEVLDVVNGVGVGVGVGLGRESHEAHR